MMTRAWTAAAWIAVCFVAVGIGIGGLRSQAKRPMTFEDLMAMKRVSDPQISPSGKWVMFSVTDVSLEREYQGESSCGWWGWRNRQLQITPLRCGMTKGRACGMTKMRSGRLRLGMGRRTGGSRRMRKYGVD